MRITLTIQEPTREQWEQLAQIAGATTIAATKQRLRDGRGAQGQRMPGYSKRYAARRQRRGRQTRNRDLQFTGRMVGNYQVTHTAADELGCKVRLGLITGRARRLAYFHQQRSKWLGWAPDDVALVNAAMQDHLDND